MSACLDNVKQIGLALLMYSHDAGGFYPEAVFSEAYGQEHPVRKGGPTGGRNQWLLPDRVSQYVSDDASVFSCPRQRFAAWNDENGKYVTSGAYAYMCGHQRTLEYSQSSSPLWALLQLYGPTGVLGGGVGTDDVDEHFVCGAALADVRVPAQLPVSFCDGFGVHGELGTHWEKPFFPDVLGGTGERRHGVTNMAFADGSARNMTGAFEKFVELLGVRGPSIRPRWGQSTSNTHPARVSDHPTTQSHRE